MNSSRDGTASRRRQVPDTARAPFGVGEARGGRPVDLLRPLGEAPKALFSILIAASVAALWIVPLASPFWLDETITAWIAREEAPVALERAVRFQFGSVYFVLPWLFLRLPGIPPEIAARLPSLLCMGGAAMLMYRIGRRAGDEATAWLATLFFVTTPEVAFWAGDARSYALVLLLSTSAVYLHLSWLDDGALRRGLGSMVAACAVVYVQPLTALIVAVLALSTLRRWPDRPRDVAAMALLSGVLLAPYIPIGLIVAGKSQSAAFASARTAFDLLTRPSLPHVLLPICAVVALGLLRRTTRLPAVIPKAGDGHVAVFLSWWLVPLVGLLLLTLATGTNVLVPRYAAGAFPAGAMLAAIVVTRFSPAHRALIATAACCLSLFPRFSWTHDLGNNWKTLPDRIAAIDPAASAPVLVRTGLIECNDASALSDATAQDYLLVPVRVYAIPGEQIALPFDLRNPEALDIVRKRVLPIVQARQRFLVAGNLSVGLLEWVEGLAQGYEANAIDVELFEFTPSVSAL
jgi:mannosyltransferase